MFLITAWELHVPGSEHAFRDFTCAVLALVVLMLCFVLSIWMESGIFIVITTVLVLLALFGGITCKIYIMCNRVLCRRKLLKNEETLLKNVDIDKLNMFHLSMTADDSKYNF